MRKYISTLKGIQDWVILEAPYVENNPLIVEYNNKALKNLHDLGKIYAFYMLVDAGKTTDVNWSTIEREWRNEEN